MRCISCLLSETSNCIQLMQGKTLPPEVNQVLQVIKTLLRNSNMRQTPLLSASQITQAAAPIKRSSQFHWKMTPPNPILGALAYPELRNVWKLPKRMSSAGTKTKMKNTQRKFQFFPSKGLSSWLTNQSKEQNDQEANCPFYEEQYNFSVQTKSNQALKLLKTMKTIIKELNLITFFKNSAENRKVFEKSQEKTTNCQTTIGRSSARSLLTEKLKNFYEKTGEENVISSHQGKFIIKQNWNFNRELSKERISEPLNSISNISDVDPESFGAYSLNYPRLASKGKRDSEDHDNHADHENQRQRDIFNEVLLRDRKRAEIPMSRNDNGCSKCQIY